MPRPIALSAVTLGVTDMAAAFAFYTALGFEVRYGGPEQAFTSFAVGEGYLNLQTVEEAPAVDWGRAIFYVDDVDAVHRRALDAGLAPEFEPRDALWDERYFHIRDPQGHEIALARPLQAADEDR